MISYAISILTIPFSSFTLLFFFFMIRPPPISTLFPYTTLFRSVPIETQKQIVQTIKKIDSYKLSEIKAAVDKEITYFQRSEEHTSELQSRGHLVCRLLLEKKKKKHKKKRKTERTQNTHQKRKER